MISMQQAGDLAWERMTRGDVQEEDVVEIGDLAGPMCVGTDVRAPELIAQLSATRDEVARRFAAGENPPATIMGALCRVFWIGYALGEDAER